MINEINQVVQPAINWSMWSAICAIATITIALILLIIRLTRNHTRLEEGHKNLTETTDKEFKQIRTELDKKASTELLKSIDGNVKLLIEKLL